MRIGLDAMCLTGMRGGFNRYLQQVIESLAEVDTGHQYRLMLNARYPANSMPIGAGMEEHRVWTPPKLQYYWGQLSPAIRGMGRHLDVWHALLAPPPVPCTAPTVVTVHDLSFERYPETFSKAALVYWRTFMPRALRRATLVLADSQSTKDDVLEYYGVPEHKVRVVYPYVTVGECTEADRLAVRERYGLPREFVLYVGSMHPRKNLVTLVKAFAMARVNSGIPHKLVLAGPRGWGSAEVASAVAACGLESEVLVLGPVPDADLPPLYQSASAFVYPSLYEGFGYPPLEAMGYGVPTIVSDASCLPEVAGDGALAVEATSAEALSAAILDVLTQPSTAARLRERGTIRVREFSRAAMRQGLLDAYEAVGS